jgi:hypothetical protein
MERRRGEGRVRSPARPSPRQELPPPARRRRTAGMDQSAAGVDEFFGRGSYWYDFRHFRNEGRTPARAARKRLGGGRKPKERREAPIRFWRGPGESSEFPGPGRTQVFDHAKRLFSARRTAQKYSLSRRLRVLRGLADAVLLTTTPPHAWSLRMLQRQRLPRAKNIWRGGYSPEARGVWPGYCESAGPVSSCACGSCSRRCVA